MSRLFTLWMVLATTAAWPQESPSDSPSLTLLQAAELTLKRNPRLQSATFGREAAAANIDQAALKPRWSVDLQVENFAGTGAISGAHDFGVSTVILIYAANLNIAVHRHSNGGIPPPTARPPDNLTPPLHRPPIV